MTSLAAPLAVVSFIIGFFPIVGSWSVYLPVAAWLAVFRDAPGQALAQDKPPSVVIYPVLVQAPIYGATVDVSRVRRVARLCSRYPAVV